MNVWELTCCTDKILDYNDPCHTETGFGSVCPPCPYNEYKQRCKVGFWDDCRNTYIWEWK